MDSSLMFGSNVESFVFDGHTIRIVVVDSEPWFVLVDLCRALDMDERSATSKVSDRLDEDQTRNHRMVTSNGVVKDVILVNESGLYEAVVRSNKSNAKPFRKWITSEVLPAIRRTGRYVTPSRYDGPEITGDMLRQLADHVDRLAVAEPKAAVHDRVVEVDGGWYVSTVARMFGYPPHRFHETLRIAGATHHSKHGATRASSFWVDRGWLVERGSTPVVTPAGLAELERTLGRSALEYAPQRALAADGAAVRGMSSANANADDIDYVMVRVGSRGPKRRVRLDKLSELPADVRERAGLQ